MTVKLSWLEARNIPLWAWCETCCHHRVLAPDLLRERLGDCEIPRAGLRLRCSRCGGRHITSRPAWPKSGVVARHNPFASPDDQA